MAFADPKNDARSRDEIRQVLEIASARWAEGKDEGKVEGRVEGKAEAIFLILAARGIAVSAEVRARIEGCRDRATMDRWVVRAMTVGTAEDLFAG